MSQYHTKNRHKYLIKLHIVLVIKYRKRILKTQLADDVKQYCYDVCSKNEVTINQMGSDHDHLHLLVDIPPTLAPTKLVMLLKQQTTWNAWQQHNAYLSKIFWKEKTLWSDGYFVCSTGDASTQTIMEYIRNQG